jgi:hypothetical protein
MKRVSLFSWTAMAISGLTAIGEPANRQLAAVIAPEKTTVQLGDSIKVSITITNESPNEVRVDRSATAFGCFNVIGPDGQTLPYVGFDGQIISNPIQVKPSATITIADALDLTDKYLFQKAGKYSIRFIGEWTGILDSPAITIEITPGHLTEFDQVAASLLPICPDGWHLVKDSRGEAAPFGRARVPGLTLHLCHNHMHAEAVYLWFTKVPTEPDPNQQPHLKSDYLGRVHDLYVFATVDRNTPSLWPTATEDTCRALQVRK